MYHSGMTDYTRATPADIFRIYRQLWGDTPIGKKEPMARTLNGNLTGKAAKLDRADLLDLPRPSQFTVAFYDAVSCLRDAMGDAEFDDWYDQPEYNDMTKGEMLVIMQGKIASLADPFVDSWCDERIDAGLIELNAPYRPTSAETDIPF
jgi:hypothetical protein